MKNKILTILITLSYSLSLHAALGRESGGGSFVVVDGKVTIADPYFAEQPTSNINKITRITFKDFPKEIRDYLNQTNRLFSHLKLKNFNNFFYKIVSSEEQRYFLVPKDRETNVPCERYLPILNRPVDNHFQFGCTFGDDTYIFIDKWTKAPIEEQALALLHERIWAWAPNTDQQNIAEFVTWTQVLVQRYVDQVLKGDRSLMPSEEVTGVSIFLNAAKNLNFWPQNVPYRIVSGGGIIYGDKANTVEIENSFLGFGTSIILDESTSAKVKIKNSTLLAADFNSSCDILDSYINESSVENADRGTFIRSKIINSYFLSDVDVRDSSMDDVYLENYSSIPLTFNYSNLQNTDIRTGKMVLNFTDMKNSTILSHVVANGTENLRVKIINSRLPVTTIENGSTLENFSSGPMIGINDQYKLTIGKESTLRNISITTPDQSWLPSLHKGFDIRVENDTKISNGRFKLEDKCKTQEFSHYYLGATARPSVIDLRGASINLVASVFSCSERYIP